MGLFRNPLCIIFYLFISSNLLHTSRSQPQTPAPSSDDCNGIFLSYTLETRTKIRPFLSTPASQPYSFSSTATILNSGTQPLKSWFFLISFSHRELIVSASPAVLSDGPPFPFSTPSDSPTAFSGFPNTDLNTPIATAGDLTQIQSQFTVIGTLFGSPPPAVPLPSSLSISDPSYLCSSPSLQSNSTTSISSCCLPNPNFKPNTTADNSTDDQFLPRRDGDLTIAYDVLQSFPSSYLALVTIENGNQLGRLDNWRLNWEWMRGEFIYNMKGAYPSVNDPSDCIYGVQGQYYKDLDFSQVANCEKIPTILDLPLTMANDTKLGLIPSCCRNGTILPKSMDPSQSESAFQLQVFKMPPDLNRTKMYPPQNFKISGGALNPNYQCGPPVRVSAAQFPDPSGLQSTTSAIASWQVVCNITRPKGSSPRCCVSFSSFYNESVVPCKTCACGCPAAGVGRTCNTTAPALLLPSEALLVPFANRTDKTKAWAELKHFNVPSPMPCGDYCGVSINWHVNSDYTKGWSARITLFNWDDVSFADWFAAVRFDKAYAGYEKMYSFNGTAVGNNTIFIQGLPGLNYLVGETDDANPTTNPRVPGKQQSVISFTKKETPGINVVGGDGFPTKVFFNGEECSLPDTVPANGGFRSGAVGSFFTLILLLIVTIYVLLEQ